MLSTSKNENKSYDIRVKHEKVAIYAVNQQISNIKTETDFMNILNEMHKLCIIYD